MTYILDACALIALINKEQGADKVKDMLEQAAAGKITIAMSRVNFIETYYDQLRSKTPAEVQEFLELIAISPINMIDTIVEAVTREASRLKAAYSISLADAIGLATAINLNGVFVTGDGELIEPETKEHAPVFWFRPPKKK
jgi:predicted nucleic acid-binding protein